jgi:hypothetical protein
MDKKQKNRLKAVQKKKGIGDLVGYIWIQENKSIGIEGTKDRDSGKNRKERRKQLLN